MFGNQAIRLLRETWSNASMLAEELYAMFQDDIPVETSAPIIINNTTSPAPALQIRGGGDGGNSNIAVYNNQSTGGTSFRFGDYVFNSVGGNLTITQTGTGSGDSPQDSKGPGAVDTWNPAFQQGGIDALDKQPDGGTITIKLGDGGKVDLGGKDLDMGGGSVLNQGAGDGSGGGSSSFPGQVVGGSGSSYSVRIFIAGTGPNALSTTVNATQLQIDAKETIPAGTWCLVAKVGAGYYMQVPVWL